MIRVFVLVPVVTYLSLSPAFCAAPGADSVYGHIPLAFEENRGQTDQSVKFLARGSDHLIFITDQKAVWTIGSGKKHSAVSMQIAGARRDAAAQSEQPLPGVSNYFIGSDPSKWKRGVRQFGSVRVAGIKKGVDLVYHGRGRELEYDLIVAPGADASNLRLHFEGAQSLTLDAHGDLLIHTAAGDLRHHAAEAWQERGGVRQMVTVSQRPQGKDVVLRVGDYDRSLPLTIDPIVSYSTYLGGSGGDNAIAIAVDSFGNAYVTGTTSSLDFPVTSGAYGGSFSDAFIAKLNVGGTALIYATYIGGSSTDSAAAIALDASGNAYLTGQTSSSDFPIAFAGGSAYIAGQDAFVAKVNSSGGIAASRYLVGAVSAGVGIAVDPSGAAYVTGTTVSLAFPTTGGSFMPSKPNSGYTGFAAKLDGGLNVVYGTYLGGSTTDTPAAVAVDAGGHAFITGTTNSLNFPTTAGAFQISANGQGDAFVAELNAQGSGLIYSTFLGGLNSDGGTAIALDSAGSAYVAGYTYSADFPTSPGAFLTSKPGSPYVYGNTSFVTKINPGGVTLGYSTYLGGTNADLASGLAVDTAGNAYILGNSNSSDFPTTPGALKTARSTAGSYLAESDVFLAELSANGASLIYSTYLGTASNENSGGLAIDGSRGVYIAGETQSLVFPATATAFQRTSREAGGYSGFVTKIDFSSPAVCNIVLSSNSVNMPGRGGAGSFTFTANNGCPWEITSDPFIAVSGPHSGFGNGSVSYTVSQNQNTCCTQTGTIRVNGGVLSAGTNIFTVNQAVGSCTDPVFNSSSVNFSQLGGIENVSVSLPSGCEWNLTTMPPWITPSNTVNSSGTGNLSLYAAPNSFSARMATFTLATKNITVSQAAGTCTISLSSTQAGVQPQAMAGSVGLTTGGACTWTAYSLVPWIQIAGNSATGQGSGSVSYVVAANPGPAPRAGSLLIGDQTFQIAQSGGPGVISTNYTSMPYTLSYCCGAAGDGGPVSGATVDDPSEMAFDSAGNLYIADAFDGRIRRVDTNGTITTFAGGGTSGLGDGGPPASATLSQPRGVAVDGSGNVYISDTGNNRIRKVSNGIITTIAGTGTAGYNGDNMPATGAQISTPHGIVVDAGGNLYFSDGGNSRIRKISSGGSISTVAGTGVAGFSGDGGSASAAAISAPTGLAIDASANLYFVDSTNYRIRKISATGAISTVAGNGTGSSSTGDGGPATSASVFPTGEGGVAVDASGSLYLGEWTGKVRKVTPDGVIQTILQYGAGYWVDGLAVDLYGNVYAGEYVDILKLTPAATFCSYSALPPSTQSPAGGSLAVHVSATTSACAWTASSSVSWIAVQTTNGSGSGSATFTVAPNNSSSSRSGTISVAGQSLTVNQDGITGAGASTATHFSIAAPASATAGVPVQFTVTALDAGNRPVGNYGDPVHFSSGDISAALPADVVLTNGAGVFSASLVTAGARTITATDLFSNSITGTSGAIAVSPATGLRYVAISPPCRVADTRNISAPYLSGNAPGRAFNIQGGACNIPSTAQAYSLNVTVVPHGVLGYLTVWPTGQSQPLVSTLNSLDARVKANAAIVPAGTNGEISAFATGDTELILDISGYFVNPASNGAALAFYSLTPCRVVDTRINQGTSGGTLAGAASRTFQIANQCGVPASAQAYSLNFTVVPRGAVGYISAYPTGQPQSTGSQVSTLNWSNSNVTANAGVVTAGTGGAIDVYSTTATEAIIDVNGYFAPAGAGGLSLYNLPPCRVLDTRLLAPGAQALNGSMDVNVLGSVCGGTPSAQGYVLNATVVPLAPLGFLTLWPQGAAQPLVSTLNAVDGAIASNLAIVPAGNTEVSAYTSSNAYLILDMSGYFAP